MASEKRATVVSKVNEEATNAVASAEKILEQKTKRCALHAKNFVGESEQRPLGEFYGDAKSSYCKRCMLIHHKIRRENLKAGTNKEKVAYDKFAEKAKLAAEQCIAWNDEDSLAHYVDRMVELLKQLESELE